MKYIFTFEVDVPDAVYGSFVGPIRALAEITGNKSICSEEDLTHSARITKLEMNQIAEDEGVIVR